MPRASVFHGIAERFLRDPKERQRHRRGNRFDFARGLQAHAHVVLTLDLDAVRFDRRYEADVLQDARMQVV